MHQVARLTILLSGLVLAGGATAYRYASLPADHTFSPRNLLPEPPSAGFVQASGSSGQAQTRDDQGGDQNGNQDGFQRVQRPGSVDLAEEYNLENLSIPIEQIHTLLPRDAIPALTDPHRQPAAEADWLEGDARIIVVKANGEVLGVPLAILDFHEIVNTTVGGEPIAATYCPLCDSATVFSRTVTLPMLIDGHGQDQAPGPRTTVLEFGVSGALYNSNVLMYDRRDKALWSQLGMDALSGPLAGTQLRMLPVEIISLDRFEREHPGASIVSNQTGHERAYGRSPYDRYFADDDLLVPVAEHGDALSRKTLGVGVAVGRGDDQQSWFVPESVAQDGYTLDTPAGKVTLSATDGGVRVESAPEGVRTAQTFYYAWSAFYPDTRVIQP